MNMTEDFKNFLLVFHRINRPKKKKNSTDIQDFINTTNHTFKEKISILHKILQKIDVRIHCNLFGEKH